MAMHGSGSCPIFKSSIRADARGLFAGEVELRDAELEVEPLNSLLAGILPYTVQAACH